MRTWPSRLVLVLVVLAIGCASNPLSGTGADMGLRDGSAACTANRPAGPPRPTACGPMTCPAGKICMISTPGMGPPPDAGPGWGYSYSCEDVPAACACSAGCGAQPSPSGCFLQLCQGEPTCSFDGATLTCWGI